MLKYQGPEREREYNNKWLFSIKAKYAVVLRFGEYFWSFRGRDPDWMPKLLGRTVSFFFVFFFLFF